MELLRLHLCRGGHHRRLHVAHRRHGYLRQRRVRRSLLHKAHLWRRRIRRVLPHHMHWRWSVRRSLLVHSILVKSLRHLPRWIELRRVHRHRWRWRCRVSGYSWHSLSRLHRKRRSSLHHWHSANRWRWHIRQIHRHRLHTVTIAGPRDHCRRLSSWISRCRRRGTVVLDRRHLRIKLRTLHCCSRCSTMMDNSGILTLWRLLLCWWG